MKDEREDPIGSARREVEAAQGEPSNSHDSAPTQQPEIHPPTEVPSPAAAPTQRTQLVPEPGPHSPVASTSTHLRPGDRLGLFRIRRFHKRGGQGSVYEAVDQNEYKRFALKTLSIEHHLRRIGDKTVRARLDALLQTRFRLEAELLATIDHENIVAMRWCDLASSPPYIALEWLDGGDLESQDWATKLREDRASIEEVLVIVSKLAQGLAVLHSLKPAVVHRDLKPANVLLTGCGSPKLVDFGVARVFAEALLPYCKGQTDLVGTPGYIAPEIWADPNKATPASDIWSLGALLCFLLIGEHVFAAGKRAQCCERANKASTYDLRRRCPTIPEDLENLIRRCLDPNPRRRPQNAQQFSEELEKIAAVRRTRRRAALRRRAPLVAAGLLAAATGAATSALGLGKPPATPASPPISTAASLIVTPSPELRGVHDQWGDYYFDGEGLPQLMLDTTHELLLSRLDNIGRPGEDPELPPATYVFTDVLSKEAFQSLCDFAGVSLPMKPLFHRKGIVAGVPPEAAQRLIDALNKKDVGTFRALTDRELKLASQSRSVPLDLNKVDQGRIGLPPVKLPSTEPLPSPALGPAVRDCPSSTSGAPIPELVHRHDMPNIWCFGDGTPHNGQFGALRLVWSF